MRFTWTKVHLLRGYYYITVTCEKMFTDDGILTQFFLNTHTLMQCQLLLTIRKIQRNWKWISGKSQDILFLA